MSAAADFAAAARIHFGIVRGHEIEPIVFNDKAGPMALLGFAYGQLNILASLLRLIGELKNDGDEFYALACLVEPAMEALELASRQIAPQSAIADDAQDAAA